jgi:hypothetical protein
MAAVGSIVQSHSKTRTVKSLKLAWTSSASTGAVSGIPSEAIAGEILRIVFTPGTSGVQPTNLYDLTLLDEDGFDVLGGKGADLSNAAASDMCPLIGDGTSTNQRRAVDGTLTLTIAAAGNSKAGSVTIYYR